ncbi:PLP-dependent transferase, partial [Staphylococcus aureus]|nr:PLP-dependent transferase [Staphylococcus aureus]
SRANGCLLVVDNTFSTPFVIKPLQHGADIVIHSLTKFFGGHSDLTAGSVTCSQVLMQKIELKARLLGGCSDPYTAWLCLRSIRTMEMRLSR